MYGQATMTGPEILLYTDPLSDVTPDGIYEMTFFPPIALETLVIRRNNIITLCEVDVFGGKIPEL